MILPLEASAAICTNAIQILPAISDYCWTALHRAHPLFRSLVQKTAADKRVSGQHGKFPRIGTQVAA